MNTPRIVLALADLCAVMLPLVLVRPATLAALLAAVLLGDGGLNRVRVANEYTATAQAAFQRGDALAASAAYERLAALGPLPEAARLNLAHAYFRAGQRSKARALYAALITSKVLSRRAAALGQLGLLAATEQNYDRALTLLRAALRADAGSATVRYNYEVLARWLAANPDGPPPGLQPPPGTPAPKPPGQKKQPQPAAADERPDGPGTAPRGEGDQPGGGDRATDAARRDEQRTQGNQPGDTRGETNQPDPTRPAGTEGPAGNGQEATDVTSRRGQTLRARQPDAALPADQARMLLDAMRAAEQQYLQQLARPPRQVADPNKPDW